MAAQGKKHVPQEGTTTDGSGESLTEPSSVCPTYSGGDTLCSGPGSSLDLSDLAEAIPNPTTVSHWTVVARNRSDKRKPVTPVAKTDPKNPKGHPDRSRPTRRARKEAPRKENLKNLTANAAAETQREPEAAAKTQRETNAATKTQREGQATSSAQPLSIPPPQSQPRWRRKARGSRGKRTAASAPTVPEKEQPEEKGQVSSKRSRLDDTQSPRGDAKRAKTDPKRAICYADAAQSHLRVAIITNPLRDLSTEQAERLKETIEDSILKAALSPSSSSAQAPSFRGNPFLRDGALAMWCEDANALAWLTKEVRKMVSPIPGTNLTVIKQSEMQKRIKAGLLLFTRITDTDTLHKLLCAQNPWYKVETWQCYSVTVSDNAKDPESKVKAVHLVLGIPEDQKHTIDSRERRVAHLSGSGYIRFFSTEETETAENAQPATEGTEPSAPEPSTSAPQPSPREMETSSPRRAEGTTSDEDDVLRSP